MTDEAIQPAAAAAAAPAACASALSIPLLINGQDRTSDVVFPVVSPSTGQTLWQASSATPTEALAAVEAAARAFPAWSATKPVERRTILLRAADLLDSRAEEFQTCMMQEIGAHTPFARINVRTSGELIRDVAGRIRSALSGSSPVCDDEGKHARVVKEPYGVVLGIAPWNAPFILGIRSVLYALAAGNTCILKGSELSPRCFFLIGSIFREAGLPDGCVNVLYHRPQDAAAITTLLIEHPVIKKINFTGSTAVGSIIAQTAARNLKPVLLELGGKNSAIVCDDADLAKAATQCALGAFLHAGQICMSTEKIIVHRSVLGPFTKQLQTAATELFSGPEVQALVQTAVARKIEGLVQDATSKGAVLLHGSGKAEEDGGSRLKPFVLGSVTTDMTIFDTESFGPHASIIGFVSDDEAVAIANNSTYGLSGSIFTENLQRGLALAARIETGAVHINSMSVHDEASLPHGGVKSSGWGRFNADAGLDEFLRSKTITFHI